MKPWRPNLHIDVASLIVCVGWQEGEKKSPAWWWTKGQKAEGTCIGLQDCILTIKHKALLEWMEN